MELLEELPRKNSIRNLVLSPCNPEDGFENYLFYKILKNESPPYLYHLIPKPLTSHSTRNSENLPLINANHTFFKNTFFPSTIIDWNKLDSYIRCSLSYKVFTKWILEFIGSQPNSIFNVLNSLDLTYLTRLRIDINFVTIFGIH